MQLSALSAKMRLTDHGPAIWCPGCKRMHVFNAKATPTSKGRAWTWDGNVDLPTFTPSMHIRVGDGVKPDGDPKNDDDWIWRTVCHSVVTGGKILFLNDCSHALVGQTVSVPDWPEESVA